MMRLSIMLSILLWFAHSPAQNAPVGSPHQTFVDNSGNPCAACRLYSYTAGTTTPIPTYTDSTGGTQNTNPITLDIAGGANIWVVPARTYKFVLKDPLGTTIWTVDNVTGSGGGGGLPCSTAYTVQFANSNATALACDPTITIDPVAHAVRVGGVITGPYFTLRNLATITQSWTLDTTSPATALKSLGPVPYSSFPSLPADAVIMNPTLGTAKPLGVSLPSGCTTGINYSTSTHAWTCTAPGTIPLTQLATQSADSVVMNASGVLASPSAVGLPTGCTRGLNYNSASHTFSCLSSTPLTCTGTTAPWSCYRIGADGTIEEFGAVVTAATSATLQTVTISFPYAFPTQQVMTVSGASQADGADDAYTVFHRNISGTGATAVVRCSTNIGGSGCTSLSAVTVNWSAYGK